jgi:hypothetical protein
MGRRCARRCSAFVLGVESTKMMCDNATHHVLCDAILISASGDLASLFISAFNIIIHFVQPLSFSMSLSPVRCSVYVHSVAPNFYEAYSVLKIDSIDSVL